MAVDYTGGVKPLVLLLVLGFSGSLEGAVKVTPLKDRVRVEIEGRLEI